jgi:hypothetical protein
MKIIEVSSHPKFDGRGCMSIFVRHSNGNVSEWEAMFPDQEIADTVVHRYNMHDELVDELGDCVEKLSEYKTMLEKSGWGEDAEDVGIYINSARAALAKATIPK